MARVPLGADRCGLDEHKAIRRCRTPALSDGASLFEAMCDPPSFEAAHSADAHAER